MVSTLTDRLFSGYSSSETNSSTGRRGNHEPKSAPTTDRDSGGYSADLENSAGTPPPFYIDLLSHHRKRHASGEYHADAPDEKKKRVEHEQEMNYIAHTARRELAHGGLRYPKINCRKPRMVPGPINMSKVSLVSSKDFAKSQKRPVTSAWNVTLTMSPDLCLDSLTSIIKSCSDHYRGVPCVAAAMPQPSTCKESVMDGDSSDVASTTSSVTEEGVDEVAAGESEAETSKVAISMGQALTISKQPRYVDSVVKRLT
uniref:Uncharacterized protein n=1 Tax=Amphora coffeiformis TaxID=265554 RepID=A0A7S3L6B6_9STRA